MSDRRTGEGVTGKLQPPCRGAVSDVGMFDLKPVQLVAASEFAPSGSARIGLGKTTESISTKLMAIKVLRVMIILLWSVELVIG
jgi:hypothetical protein